eukprot:TRINITY_DN4507_c0_g1_i1.p1 TRINITY_DN4507_c0_g1~~TRINITY_DN4507_c0_g1_i1.p1  ORF type:complete len:189 (-),score=16.78 TRINITY_DN4507_c0_g1_i1:61-627(-)
MNDDDEDSFDVMNSYDRRDLARKLLSNLPKDFDSNDLWKVMSKDPIFNSITVYGSYMNPKDGTLETRLPDSKFGFIPVEVDLDQVDDTDFTSIYMEISKMSDPSNRTRIIKLKDCLNCKKKFDPHRNKPGQCAHKKSWHGSFDDCNYVKCGFGLGRNIGMQHWGCCYSTDKKKLQCKLSKEHVHCTDD